MSRHSEVLADLLGRAPMPSIVAAAAEHTGTVLCVGGAVRDALLGRRAADVDIAVSGDLADFVDGFSRHCGRRPAAIGDAWRDTHRTFIAGTQVDIGRMLGGEAEDLAQRDFTINAMAVKLSAPIEGAPELIDLHGGVEDIERRTIRMLSADTLLQDPLRLLRAVRYAGTLEGFEIDPLTEAAIAKQATTIRDVAAERVHTEWSYLLAGRRWADAVELSVRLGLDHATLGARVNLEDALAWSAFEQTPGVVGLSAADFVTLRLSSLLVADTADGKSGVQRRLIERRWPAALARRACRIGAWARDLDGADRDDLIDWALEDHIDAGQAAMLARALSAGDRSSARESSIAALEEFARRADEARWLKGADLRDWGMEPGPQLGELLHHVARGQLERRWDTAAAARTWARRRLAARGSSADG